MRILREAVDLAVKNRISRQGGVAVAKRAAVPVAGGVGKEAE